MRKILGLLFLVIAATGRGDKLKFVEYSSHLNCVAQGKKDVKLPNQVSLFPDTALLQKGDEGEYKNGVIVLEGDANPELMRWTLGTLVIEGSGIAKVSYVVPLGLGHQRRVVLDWTSGKSLGSDGFRLAYKQKTEARNPQLKSESGHDLICQSFATSFKSVSGQ